MSYNMTTASDKCRELYEQPFIDGMPLMASIERFLSPRNSHNTNGHHQIIPKANAFKPIRKRSRASKRTPFTLLKANTSNFRALVQQFTGCPNTTTMSHAFHEGPITLNFQQGSKQRIFQNHIFGTTNFNREVPWQKQPEQLPMQQLKQEHVKSSEFLPTSGNSYSMEVSDGLLFDNNDFSLQELSNALSCNNDGFIM